jgi:chemotaxis protein CheZ
MMSQYIGFKLGGQEFAIPIMMVQEIMKPAQATRLPTSPDFIQGIINLRDKTISVLDLKARLGMPSSGASDMTGNIIVLSVGKMAIGAKVDSITGVMNVENNMVSRDLKLVDGVSGKSLRGIANLGEKRIVMLLDFPKLLNIEDASLLEDDIVETRDAGDGKVEVTRKITGRGGDMFIKEIRDAMEKSSAGGLNKDVIANIMDNVQKLLDAFVSGDMEAAERAIEQLSSLGEREMFSEVGKMTRRLHDSLNEFKTLIDPRLKDIAQEGMPAAIDKLMWVIMKTDEAANQTITIAEMNQARISGMQSALDALEKYLVGDGSFSGSDEVRATMDNLKKGLADMNDDFTEIVLAQEFQDLTGQIIKKVVRLVSELESELVKLVKVFGGKVEPLKMADKLPGPSIKAIAEAEAGTANGTLSDQEDVDKLLAEFGF